MIFDCDGVLVDSEPHSRAAWVAVLRGYGLSVGIDDVVACTGMGFRATHERLTTDTPGWYQAPTNCGPRCSPQ